VVPCAGHSHLAGVAWGWNGKKHHEPLPFSCFAISHERKLGLVARRAVFGAGSSGESATHLRHGHILKHLCRTHPLCGAHCRCMVAQTQRQATRRRRYLNTPLTRLLGGCVRGMEGCLGRNRQKKGVDALIQPHERDRGEQQNLYLTSLLYLSLVCLVADHPHHGAAWYDLPPTI